MSAHSGVGDRATLVQPISSPRRTLPAVVAEHVVESAFLRSLRSRMVRTPSGGLFALQRLDSRLAAHLSGIVSAGDLGILLARGAMDPLDSGSIFVSTVCMLQAGDLDDLIATAEQAVEGSIVDRGLSSALGWVTPAFLHGITPMLFGGPAATRRFALVACGLHGVHPGTMLDLSFASDDDAIRVEAARAAMRCGLTESIGACLEMATMDDATAGFEGARAALLLGDRGASLETMKSIASGSTAARQLALHLFCATAEMPAVRSALRSLARDSRDTHSLISATGHAGDTHFVPWLIDQMRDPRLARIAGDALTTITGIDLGAAGLTRAALDDLVAKVTEGPADERVAVDVDDGLAWPDPDRVTSWWDNHANRFPSGERIWMGRPASAEHVVRVLAAGTQRHRMTAAVRLCLVRPGTPLFNVAAPAWRQKRLLERIHS